MHRAMQLLSFTLFGAVAIAAAPLGGRAEATPLPPPAPAPSSHSAASHPAPAAEPVIATPGASGDYLRGVHNRLHSRWTETFIKLVAPKYPADHPINHGSRHVVVAITIRWDGSVADVTVKRSSGSPDFDRAALDVARKSAPFPLPGAEVLSDDSYAHLEWTFARDVRGCAADARVFRFDDPLDVALPRLLMANKVGEALRRVAESSKDKGDGGLDAFARWYLSRTSPDPVLNVMASVALVNAGDKFQTPRLRAALASPHTVEIAARGLSKTGADVCEVVRAQLDSGATTQRELGIAAVRAVAVAGANVAGCGPSLSAIVADVRQPKELRLSALETIVAFIPAGVKPTVTAVLQDKEPAVRGAAVLLSVKKGGGRPEMYRLAPLLRHKAVEIRGAASAGMVRAGGDQALDQLYLLARETDPRPGQAVAAELAQLATPASAAFLGRMAMKGKGNLPVQLAAARALAARKDSGARTERETIAADGDVPAEVRTEVRTIATAASRRGAAAPTAQAPAVAIGAAVEPFHALLKENRQREAADWIVARLQSLEPGDAVTVLGSWLRRSPSSLAHAPSSSPTSPPTSAPTSAQPHIIAPATASPPAAAPVPAAPPAPTPGPGAPSAASVPAASATTSAAKL